MMRLAAYVLLGLSSSWLLVEAGSAAQQKTSGTGASAAKKTPAPAKKTTASKATTKKTAAKKAGAEASPASRGGPWREPTYADSTDGDVIRGEDLVVRRVAVEALGPYNGSVVVVDPSTGRILTIVNQKLAFKSGFQPCSAFKVLVGLAGLIEGILEPDTPLRISANVALTLTEALARSNNPFFESLGVKLGFDRVSYYARLFGLGERATLDVEAEQTGTLPGEPPKNGGVGMMCSFGEGIQLTPLQYAAALSAIANGGTLYYLQHPETAEEAEKLVPRVKRHLDIAPWLSGITPGLTGTVEYGTGKRAAYDPLAPVLGKTGTCTDRLTPTHLGWFGSFNNVGRNRLVVVVLLTGGAPVGGGLAAEIAGSLYKSLSQEQYFAQERLISPVALVGASNCCR